MTGWLYWVDSLGDPQEFVNHARTNAYIKNLKCDYGVTNVLDDGGCAAYRYKPCYEDAVTLAVTDWKGMVFTTPSDSLEPAPWWDGVAGSASSEAMGMIIEDITGLDGAQHGRSVGPVGGRRGGARFGPLSNRHRVVKINMLLHGTTPRSLEFLFRWVEDQLISCCGSTCDDMSLWVRTHCPTIAYIEEGVYRLYDVALLEGPIREANPMPRGNAWINRVSFTLGTGDPCMYAPNISVAASSTTRPEAATSFVATTGQTVTINRTTGPDHTEMVIAAPANYALLPGVSGNYLSVPDAAALDIVGDLEIVSRVALTDWTPSADSVIVAKYSAAGQHSYQLYVTTTGALILKWSNDGTAELSQTSSVPAFVNGTAYWVKATIDVVNGANRVIEFYWAADSQTEPTSWTLISTHTVAGNTSIFSSTSVLELGTRAVGTLSLLAGKMFRAIVRNGIAGTKVLDVNIDADYKLTFSLDIYDIINTNSLFMPFPTYTSQPILEIPPCDAFLGPQRVIAQVVPASVGTTSPVVRIRTEQSGGCPELRIIGVEDPHDYGISAVNGCNGEITGMVELARLPAGAELVIDFGRRIITYEDSSTNGPIPGWAYVTSASWSTKRWISFARCAEAYVIVELNSLRYDAVTTPLVIKDYVGTTMTFSNPTVDVWYVPRIGCC